MEASAVNMEASTSSTTRVESIELEDNDDDLAEIDNAEILLKRDQSENLKFLEFERQMFLDCIYNDALTICAK
jgi:hypothetical protein